MSAETKNLKAITDAIKDHNKTCEFPATSVSMNPFEIDRLGWEEIMGLPIEPDERLGTGSFRINCGKGNTGEREEQTEKVDQREPVYA